MVGRDEVGQILLTGKNGEGLNPLLEEEGLFTCTLV